MKKLILSVILTGLIFGYTDAQKKPRKYCKAVDIGNCTPMVSVRKGRLPKNTKSYKISKRNTYISYGFGALTFFTVSRFGGVSIIFLNGVNHINMESGNGRFINRKIKMK